MSLKGNFLNPHICGLSVCSLLGTTAALKACRLLSHTWSPSLPLVSEFSYFCFSGRIFVTWQCFWLPHFYNIYFMKVKLLIFYMEEVVGVLYNEPVNAAMSEFNL